VMGGYHAYASVDLMERERRRYPAFNIPVAVVPASIDNNLPGWMMAVGADTALNTVVDAIDMLRMSASASKRAFIVETMGRGCGFLPLVGGLAGGAEKAYLPETGITLAELETDIKALVDAFDSGRNFYLAVVGEGTSEHYTTDVLGKLYEAEGNGRFSVRESVVGHLQQGGTPSPFDRINATRPSVNPRPGLASLSEDRKRYGLLLGLSVADNSVLPSYDLVSTGPVVRNGAVSRATRRYVDQLRIKTPSIHQAARNLSGGNQQKVVLAKWLLRDVDILIFDEPTRGIDIGARAEIYQLMNDLAAEGKSILLVSSDLDEVLHMSDRVLVMCEGRLTGELDIADATQVKIMELATKQEERDAA